MRNKKGYLEEVQVNLRNRVLKAVGKRRPILLSTNIVNYNEEFKGKTALVIGGGSGIGLAIAQELKNCGATVIIAGRTKREIDHFTSEVLDVSELELLEISLKTIVNRYGKIEIVVNSQGVLSAVDYKKEFYSVNIDDFEKTLTVNLESVYFVTQFFCKYFEQNSIQGHILNICSTEGLKGTTVPYGISKAGVIRLTQGIGKIMAEKGITINGISPGATATHMMNMDAEHDLRKNYIPSQRANIPIEIAKVSHMLLSDVGKRMCGQVVTVDGGESLK